ncbi:MAG: diguanylate cyclase [Acidobacteriota bacterium]
MIGGWQTKAQLRAQIDALRADLERVGGGPDQGSTALDSSFDTLFNEVPIAYHELDAEGRIVRVNAAELDLLGYTRTELVGRYVWELSDEPDVSKAAVLAKLSGALAPASKRDRTYYRKNGIPVPISVTDRVIHDAAGRIVGMRTALVDLTERHLAEQGSEQLSMLVMQLEEQNRQNTVLNEMREFLLACGTTEEIDPLVSRAMGSLFPGWIGALYLMSPSKTDLEPTARWGDRPAQGGAIGKELFGPDACWGLRKGGGHRVDDVKEGLLCHHVEAEGLLAYVCVPLMARGEVLGLLHLRQPDGEQLSVSWQSLDGVSELANTIAGILSLAIWNMRLRSTLAEQAIRDSMTGLFNRAFMESTLSREIHLAQRRSGSVSVIMADVDHFKALNDLYGHAAGDLVLTGIADVFKTLLRRSDVACRYGGEEFTLILPDCTLDAAGARAEVLKNEVKARRFQHGPQTIGPVSISMGVSSYPGSGVTSRDLLRTSDRALYLAKQTGRDRVVLDDTAVSPPA